MPKIPEMPPILTGNTKNDLDRLREYLIRFVQEYSTEEKGYASSNDSRGTEESSSNNQSVVPSTEITVDEELSTESTNPVQNRAVAEALNSIPTPESYTVKMVTGTITILSASGFTTVYTDLSLDGVTPVGIVGWSFSSSALSLESFNLVSETRLRGTIRNNSTSMISNASVYYYLLCREATS